MEELDLLNVVNHNDLENVKNLIEKSKQFMSSIDLNRRDPRGNTALMLACKKGYIDIVKELIKADVDINIKDIYGKNALMIAASIPKYRAVKK